jgi:hypothetical protein
MRFPRAALSLALTGLLGALPAIAVAAEPAGSAPSPSTAAPATPEVHHAPLTSSVAHEPLRFEVQLDHPEMVRWVGVVYRSPAGAWRSVALLRSSSAYVAVIPAEEVEAPGLAYTIELQSTSGETRSVFASRAAPWAVEIVEDRTDVRERAALERLSGRRSVATSGAEFASFGQTQGRAPIPCGVNQSDCTAGKPIIPTVHDQYWKVEIGYTYRPLRTIAEFSLKGGVVRGQSLARSVTTYDIARYKVGLNYAEPSVRFRLADAWHLETSLLTSITEVGFSVGGGGALLIGDPYGSKLTLGFETIGIGQQYFGSRFYSRLDLVAGERVKISPMIEITDMPHADSFGVRLLTDVSVDIAHGFFATARAGYQARRSTSGGVALGTTLGLAF